MWSFATSSVAFNGTSRISHRPAPIDVESGHYSFTGMMRRLREQAALARRSGEALSCVMFGFDPVPEGANADGMELAGMEFSLALHDLTRDSDIVGRPSLNSPKVLQKYSTWGASGLTLLKNCPPAIGNVFRMASLGRSTTIWPPITTTWK